MYIRSSNSSDCQGVADENLPPGELKSRRPRLIYRSHTLVTFFPKSKFILWRGRVHPLAARYHTTTARGAVFIQINRPPTPLAP
jgi:hypothetical protein